MGIYDLTVVVDGFDMDSEFQNAGLDCLSYEAAVSRTGGVTRVDASVTAPSAIDAIMQLLSDLRSINVNVIRVDPTLVSVSEIAERCDVSRETARLWAKGQRRRDFPAPYCVTESSSLWFWSDVQAWAVQHGMLEEHSSTVPSNIVEAMNGAFAYARNRHREGWLKPVAAPVAHIAQKKVQHVHGGWRLVGAKTA